NCLPENIGLQRLLFSRRRLGIPARPCSNVRHQPFRSDPRRDPVAIARMAAGMAFEVMARHSMDFWLQAEDLPHPDNRIYYKDGKVHLDLVETNPQALVHLKRKLKQVLQRAGHKVVFLARSLYLGKNIPLGGTAHQAGTARFGSNPATSVLDLNCK